MYRSKLQASANPEGLVRNAHESGNQVIIYDDYSALPMRLTFFGDKWWITTAGVPLQTVDEYFDDDRSDMVFLCKANEKPGALAITKMLAKAVENAECAIDNVMEHRMKCLERLGVQPDVKDEKLELVEEIITHRPDSHRSGKYSLWIHAGDSFDKWLLDCEGFDSKTDAQLHAAIFLTFLESIGISYSLERK